MKTYKFTDSKMQSSNGFQFEIGKTYREEDIDMCISGFHSSKNAIDAMQHHNICCSRLFECETGGETIDEMGKICSQEITLTKELTLYEALRVLNEFEGEENTNSGFGNVGSHNRGNHNIGNHNCGNYNIGNRNYGNHNKGNRKKGNHNG